jgi:hypothetical protein
VLLYLAVTFTVQRYVVLLPGAAASAAEGTGAWAGCRAVLLS